VPGRSRSGRLPEYQDYREINFSGFWQGGPGRQRLGTSFFCPQNTRKWAEFCLEVFDFGAVVAAFFFESGGVLAVPVVGALAGVFPALELFKIEAFGAAKFADLRFVHGDGLEDGVEFIGGIPSVGYVVTGGHEEALVSGFSSPSVESGKADALLFSEFSEFSEGDGGGHLCDDGVFSFLWVAFHNKLAPPALHHKCARGRIRILL
jgi:hypothetical protein